MKAVIERVKRTKVIANGEDRGEIPFGLLVFLGVGKEDTEEGANWLADKIRKMRIFSDENGKMNRSVQDVSGGIAVISNFTLYANASHGNRPDFFSAASPDLAEHLYQVFLQRLGQENIPLVSGIFGADMQIETVCDGPVTIILDTADMKKGK